MFHKNETALQYGRKLTSRNPPQAQMAVILKGTYRLVPGEPLALIEDMIEAGFMNSDVVADSDLDRVGAISYPSDFADFKPNAEVMLRGAAYPPTGADTAVAVEFRVGTWSKQLLVVGPRVWKPGLLFGASVSDPLPFESLPLTWENAFGGPGVATNPVGLGADGTILPMVESPRALIKSQSDKPAPASFLPINPLWAPRAGKRGKNYGKKWRKTRAPFYSDDFDWSYFSAAPADQQLQGYLRGDESLLFQNLSRKHPTFEAQLPGVRVRHFVRYLSGEEREVPLVLDTLFADLEVGKLYLTWRGLVDVAERDFTDVTACLSASERLDEPPKPAAEYFAALAAHEEDPLGLKDSIPPDIYPKFMEVGLAELNLSRDLMGLPPLPPPPPHDPGLPPPSNPVSALLREKLGGARPDMQLKIQEQIEKVRRSYDLIPATKEAPKQPFDALLAEGIEQAQSGGAGIPMPAITRPNLQTGTYTPPKVDLSLIAKHALKAKARLAAAGVEAPQLAAIDRILEVPELQASAQVLDGPDYSGQDLREHDFAGEDLRGASFVDADLRGAHLVGFDLSGADFSRAQLGEADLAGARLTGATLVGAVAPRVRLAGAHLEGAQLAKADLREADLSEAILTLVQGGECDLTHANLSGADLTLGGFGQACLLEANLSKATLEMTVLTKSDLRRANLSEATGSMTSFNECLLEEANLRKARLPRGSFERADVRRANFTQAFLEMASFRTAQAQGANFAGAEMPTFVASRRANFTGAILSAIDAPDSIWLDAILDDADFSHADLRRGQFNGARCDRTRFDGAELREAAMRKLKSEDGRFVQANLCKTELVEATLTRCDLKGANLYDAKFLETSLETCDLGGALFPEYMMTEQP